MLKLKSLTAIIGSVIILGLISPQMTCALDLSKKDTKSKNYQRTKNSKKYLMKEYAHTAPIFANGIEGTKTIARSNPRSIINYCKDVRLNYYAYDSSYYQRDECRKTMPCAKKNRSALITTIYSDKTAKVRDITVTCTK